MSCWLRQRDLPPGLFALDLMRAKTRLASFLLTRDQAGAIIPEQTVLFISRTDEDEEIGEEYRHRIWTLIRDAEGIPGTLRETLLTMEPYFFEDAVEILNTSGGLHFYVGDGPDWERRYGAASAEVSYKLLRYGWLWPSPHDRRN